MPRTQKSHLIILGAFVVLFLAFNIIGIAWNLSSGHPDEWSRNVFPGKVASRTDELITIVNAKGTTRSFIIAPESKFFAGRNQIIAAAIPVGQFVIITVEDDASTTVRDIRVVKDGPREKDAN